MGFLSLYKWLQALTAVLILSFCNLIDHFFLWTTTRKSIEATFLSCYFLKLLKWINHRLTGQSELRRLLSESRWYILDQGGKKPRPEMVVNFLEIWKASSSLSVIFRKFVKKDEIDPKYIEQVCTRIAYKKLIPIRGPLFKILKDSVIRIAQKYILINRVKILCGIPFNCSDKDHMIQLYQLWLGLKGEKDQMPDIPSEEWKELGFQGTDPTTDFRGVGIFGLHQLVYFAETREGSKIYHEAQYGPYWYSFAVVSLNATDTICKLLKAGYFDKLLFGPINFDSVDPLLTLLDRMYFDLMILFHQRWMDSEPENLFAFNDIYSLAIKDFEGRFALS